MGKLPVALPAQPPLSEVLTPQPWDRGARAIRLNTFGLRWVSSLSEGMHLTAFAAPA